MTETEVKALRKKLLAPEAWFYPQGIDLVVTASGTVTMAPKTIEEAAEFRENDLCVEGVDFDD